MGIPVGYRRIGCAAVLILWALSNPIGAWGSDAAPQVPPLLVPMDQMDGMQRATVVLDSYSYTPHHLIVQAGKPVELILTSITTLTPHNFVLMEKDAGLSIERDVSAGRTVTVQFTPRNRARILFSATNGCCSCRVIATRAWKGCWKSGKKRACHD